MIVSKLLMYGLTDEENYLVDFYFDENQVQAVFVASEEHLSIVISGQIYELEYNQQLFQILKHNLSIKTLGFN